MNLRDKVCAAALVVAVCAAPASGATRIVLGDSSAAASSTYTLRDAKYAVNGAGLVGNLHSNTADRITWMNQTGAVSGQWFRVDLGQVFELSHFKFWNFNFWHASVQTTNRGIREAEVYLSNLDTTPVMNFTDPSQWTRVIDKVTFAKASGQNTYAGEPDVSLSGLQGRWLALRALSNYSSTDLTIGISELQVFAASKPVVLASAPTAVTPAQATLSGALTYDGGSSNTIYAFWGTTDGGTVSSAWDHVVSLGYQPTGTVSTTVSVAADAEYFFRLHAANAEAGNWSAAQGFLTAPVSVEMPASISEGSGVLPVTFRRPAAMTNTPVTLTFGLSGTALGGSDYLPPATSVLLPTGSATAQALLSLVDDLTVEPDETLTVGLGPSACVRDATGTNSTVIADDEGLLNCYAWSHLMRVTLSGYSGAAALTNFPVALWLHEGLSGFRYADFAAPADGGDLRVTDAATGAILTYEIETWNPAGTSLVWVCVAELTGNATAIDLHWGNPDASLPGYATGGLTWADGFSGVWHLQQPGGPDSTPNRNHGAAYGNVTAPGLLGSAQYFDGNDYIQVPDHPSIGTNVISSLTLSVWLRSDVTLTRTNELWRMLEKGDNYFLGQGFNSAGGVVLIVKYTNQVYGVGSIADIPSNEWQHICGTYNGTSLRLYTNGVLASSQALSPVIDDDKLPLRIGSDDSGKYFKGALDETRVESAVRSADWIKACYDSQREGNAFCAFRPAVRLFRGTIIGVR